MLAEVQFGSPTNLSWDGNETLEQLLECEGWNLLLASNTLKARSRLKIYYNTQHLNQFYVAM